MSADESRLTKAERADLQRAARLNAKVARNGVAAREAELRAMVEEQLAAMYPPKDPRWSAIREAAEAAVGAADEQIRLACVEAGIPEEFRPSMHAQWAYRGENASKTRRTELRAVARAQIEARGRAARNEIDRAEAATVIRILADGLRSEAAAEALASIPSPDDLMPPLHLAEIEAAHKSGGVE